MAVIYMGPTGGLSAADKRTATANMLEGTSILHGRVQGTIPKRAAATITPGAASQTIGAGQYLAGAQTIAGDPNLTPENIKAGVTLFGVTGTWDGTYPYDGPYTLYAISALRISGSNATYMTNYNCNADPNYFEVSSDGQKFIATKDFTARFDLSYQHLGSGSEGIKIYSSSGGYLGELSNYSANRYTHSGSVTAKLTKGAAIYLLHYQTTYNETMYYFRVIAQ